MLAFYLLGFTGLLLSGCSSMHSDNPDEAQSSMLFASLGGEKYATDNPHLSSHLRAINNYRPEQSASNPTQIVTAEPKVVSKPKAYPYDQKLSHEILAALISQDALKHAHIRVSGYYGDILIFGEVPDQQAVALAQNIASSFKQVKNIRTALTVGDNLPAAQRAEDSINNTQVKAEIAKLDIPHSHLQVATNANQVFIVGPLSAEQRQQVKGQLEQLGFIHAVYFF